MLEYYKTYLEEAGIDLNNADYKETEAYVKIKDELILDSDGFMTMEQFIERYLLEPNQVYETYDSVYDMGNPYELDDAEGELSAVAKEIIDKTDLGLEVKAADLEAEAIELVGTLTRQGGLIDRLRTELNFDLKLFDPSNLKHKAEICKIIYFLYLSEHKTVPEILGNGKRYFNTIKFLTNPSMESIDNASIGRGTYNGRIIAFIKHSLEKEIAIPTIATIKNTLFKIVSEWEAIIDNGYTLLNFMCERDRDYDICTTVTALSAEQNELSTIYNSKGFTHSPIETLYLKVVQHEFIGSIKDVAMANCIQPEYDYDVPQGLVNEMIKLHDSPVDIDNIEKYLDDNASRIAEYVYLGSIDDKKEAVRKIKHNKDKICRWLDFCVRAKPFVDINDIANELQIISFLQVIILEDQSETFDYIFYNYQNHMKHRPQVQGALKNDKRTIDALQIYWLRKVTDRWYANVGRSSVRIKMRYLEAVCDDILLKILSRPNLDEMQEVHRHYLNRVGDELITTEEQIQATLQLEEYLRTRGFQYVDEGYKIRHAFLYPTEIPATYRSLTLMIDDTIKSKDQTLDIDLEASTANGEKQIKFAFQFEFDYESKVCSVKKSD